MSEESVLPPTTTAQDNLITARQTRINLIWEITQSLISILITASIVYSMIYKSESSVVNNAFFLIVGFYFSRTNHAAIGGVGPKPEILYQGR